MHQIGHFGGDIDRLTVRIGQNALRLRADLDRGQTGNLLTFLALFLAPFFLILLISQRLIARFGDSQIRLRPALTEIGGKIEDAELGVILQGDEQRAAIGREIEQFRVVDARDPVSQLKGRDVDDVDGIPIAAGNEDPRPRGVELQVPGAGGGPDPLHDLQRPAIQHMHGIVLLARHEHQTGVLRRRGKDQSERKSSSKYRIA